MKKPNPNRIIDRLGDKLVMLREKAGLSQAELGKQAGISASAISMIEAGEREPMLSTAVSICDVLNISLDTLSGRSTYSHNEFTVRVELTKAQQRLAKIAALAT